MPFIFLCPFLHAATAAQLVSKCDNFELAVQISKDSRKFANQCLNTDVFRAAKIQIDDARELVFENYLHQDKFWTARVSKNVTVEKAWLQVVRFAVAGGVIAGHVQYRVQLAPGDKIQLTHPDGSQLEVDDLVVSFEAARPKDVSYNFAHGMIENYVLVGRISSSWQRLKEYGKGYMTEQYQLKLNDEDKKSLLFNGVITSAEQGYATFYDTLKPNCTTEAFDIIDQLPSQKSKGHKAFLTMLSNDPVVGPTVQGLVERDLLAGCDTDLYMDDASGKVVVTPVDGKKCAERKSPAQSNIPFLAQLDELPYAVVVASNPEDQQKFSRSVEKAAYQLAPQILQQVGASVMLGGNDSSSYLLASLKTLKPLLDKTLENLEKELGNDSASAIIYMAPWRRNPTDDISFTSIDDVTEELGLDARLPLNVYRLTEGIGGMEATWEFNDNLSAAAQWHKKSQATFGFLGLAAQISVNQTEGSRVTLQVVGYSSPMKKALVVENDQVNISEVVVPEALSDFFTPVSIITLSQAKGQKTPQFSIDFGGLEGTYSYGSQQTLRDGSSVPALDSMLGLFKLKEEGCVDRAYNVPFLNGSAAALKIVNVKLKIFAVDFDLENLVTSNIEVRTDAAYGLIKKCERDEEVNRLFTDSANKAITDQVEKVKKSPGLSLLNKILGSQ